MNVQTEQQYLAEAANLAARYEEVRGRSVALSSPLSEEDCCGQSMPDASPIKWHLAHTTWFFETFILERFEQNFRPFHPAFRVLFNSYYNGVGDKHARAQRGLLTRPPLPEVLDYRRAIDQRLLQVLTLPLAANEFSDLAMLIELGLQHEQQHQELMMTDVLHLLSCNPLKPAYVAASTVARQPAAALQWLPFKAGVVQIGHAGREFCFDNEIPLHRQFVEDYEIASRLVTNGEYRAFIEAGGYENAALWLSEGWDWVQTQRLSHPLYWQRDQDSGEWQIFTLNGLRALDADAPATQLSYFEADAYARWAGARSPTEAAWEHAATQAREDKNGAIKDLFGTCWQWTSSSYAAYPGYATAEGALGEYNGKFMSNQYVLRGSSSVTPQDHSRTTYRNFFPATARWQFSGIRLAR